MWARLIAVALALAPSVAVAGETITYTYDAHGRLVRAEHAGTVNDDLKAEYQYDASGNRTVKTVENSTNAP